MLFMVKLAIVAVLGVFLLTPLVAAQVASSQPQPQGWVAYVAQIASAVLPMLVVVVVTAIRKGMGHIPPWLLPVVSVFVGASLDVLTALVQGGPPSSWGVLSGLAATGLHQVKRQLYDKQN